MAKSDQTTSDIVTAAPELVATMTMPTAAQIAASRSKRKSDNTAGELPMGSVLGLPVGWVPAVLDPALPEGRKATLRAKWSAKGWIALEGLHQVVGYPLPVELWVKSSEDFKDARAEQDAKLQELARSGQMILGYA
tara:strand:- start:143 stop:550 length:408 start_codon:yes stop_codon:yes gene_type:complete